VKKLSTREIVRRCERRLSAYQALQCISIKIPAHRDVFAATAKVQRTSKVPLNTAAGDESDRHNCDETFR
jgi:hypothetical protein